MRIAILGGGISGLATYLELRKHLPAHLQSSIKISLFESHDFAKHAYSVPASAAAGVPTTGGGYGLAANGMASLKRLDASIHDRIVRNSFPTPRFQLRTRQGWTLGAINCVIGDETCCMVTREVVMEALYESLPEGAVSVRKVVEVVDGEEGAVVRFEGGAEERFDLVVGADGIWSRAREGIGAHDDEREGPEYRGLSTLGGFVETKYLTPTSPSTDNTALPYPQSRTIMTIGPNGFLGYTPCTTSPTTTITADHISGRAAVPVGDMAFWWARSAHADPKVEPDVKVERHELEKRMQSWRDPNVKAILRHGMKTAMIPTYVLPRQRTWAGKRVALVGDAAHALPTSSGQGVSQALEDAEALAMLLAHHLSATSEDGVAKPVPFETIFEQYMTIRKAHVERILDAGNKGGDASRDLNVFAEFAMYAFFWVALKLFGGMSTKEIESYDVVSEVNNVLK